MADYQMDLDKYLDLPEDPELQLVAFEKKLRKDMWDSISSETNYSST
jgi:hypothetical protein